MSEPLEVPCRHCKGSIISSEQDRSIGHTVPVCEWFERIMKHTGAPGELVMLDPQGKRLE